MVEPKRTRVVDLGAAATVRVNAESVLFGLRRLLHGTRFAGAAMSATRDSLDALTQQLMTPLGVPPDVPLVVVPSVRLRGVLWSPLHTAPVTIAPSAGLWARARRGRPDDGRARVAVVAGPGLPGAVAEAAAVAAEHDGADTLLPPRSTVDATVELVKDAQLAHLACHGRFRSDSPLFSALELSDGQLTLYEMLARGVAPQRVVLASCHSGTQQAYDGNEMLGFVGAMMANGSAGIAAVDLLIPDDARNGSMSLLHRRVSRGDSLASAVWHAREALSAGGPEEYVTWCGLSAFGAG